MQKKKSVAASLFYIRLIPPEGSKVLGGIVDTLGNSLSLTQTDTPDSDGPQRKRTSLSLSLDLNVPSFERGLITRTLKKSSLSP